MVTHEVTPGGPEITALIAAQMAAPIGARRRIIGICGAPGSGTATLARVVSAGLAVPVVDTAGFHLADVELLRRGLLDRKGAPETFDAWGLAALLARIAVRPSHVIMAPTYERDLGQPVAGAVPVPIDARSVVVQGSYLLLDEPAWREVRTHLDAVWHVEVDDDVRRDRLLARHARRGRSPAEAEARLQQVDEPNAARVRAARPDADVVLDLTGWDGRLADVPPPRVDLPVARSGSQPPDPLADPPVRETHRL